jgi:hypothetical protein
LTKTESRTRVIEFIVNEDFDEKSELFAKENKGTAIPMIAFS